MLVRNVQFPFNFRYNSGLAGSLTLCMTQATELTRLDKLIDSVSVPAESQCELLREHLESARTYLQGGMNEEYMLSLRLANETVNCIADERRRHRAAGMLGDLMSAE